MSSRSSRSGRSPTERRSTSDAPTVVHHDMQRAKVSKFDARRGSGQVVLSSSGRKARVPWSALRNANVAALSVGDIVFVEIDHLDRGRVEVIRVVDA